MDLIDDNVEVTEEAPSALEVPLEGDDLVRIGDWEGKASDVRKNWISSASLQEMREKDKGEVTRQVQEQVQAEKVVLAQQYQQERYRQQAAQPQQQQQQQRPMSVTQYVAEAMNAARTGHSGFMHADTLEPLLGQLIEGFQRELAARDRMQGAVGQKLDQWYGDYQGQSGVLNTVAGSYADREWDKFLDGLEKTYPDIPRGTLETLACAYEAEEGESPEQLRDSLTQLIGEHVDGMNAHRASVRTSQREQRAKERAAGIPGIGGQATPTRPGKMLKTAEEITDHFAEFDGPAS